MTTGGDGEGALKSRLGDLVDRLLWAAELALDAGQIAQARATVEDVRTLDRGNERAAAILGRIDRVERRPAGERALMTMLFSDVVASTELAEQLEPESLRDIFDLYRSEAQIAIDRYGGQVVKYLGDGILATFGYPRAHEDDARRGALAALSLLQRVAESRHVIRERHGIDLQIRVGIHTGRVVVADLGSGSAREHDTILGVAPNLAARIQSEAEPGQVVLSDVTQQLVEADFDVRSLGLRDLKGISRDVEVFVIEGVRSAASRLDAERYRHGDLVGRTAIRRTLADGWESVRAHNADGTGPGLAYLVAGEAGIGKSRLVVDLRRRVSATGGDTLATGCSPYHSDIALWPVSQMMIRVLGLDDAGESTKVTALVGHLETLGMDPELAVPLVGPLVGLDEVEGYPAPQLDPTAVREATITTLLDWLRGLARLSPRMLLVEDLEWADPTTLDVLGRAAVAPPAGALAVMTIRDDRVVPWRGEVPELILERLDDTEAAALVGEFDPERRLADETRSKIVARSEGIPLFVEELTRSALSAELSDVVPMRLEELLAGRLRGADLDIRLAQAAASIGVGFDAPTLEAVVDRPVAAGLSSLERAEIVERVVDAEDTYRFRHGMLRDAAYDTQVTETKRETHEAIARVLTDQAADPALIARHLDLADQPVAAVPQYIAGAQVAQTRGTHAEAATMLSRALELVQGFPHSDDRDLAELTVRMLRTLSVSSVQGYAAPGVRSDITAAGGLTERLGERPEVMPSLIAIWAYWLAAGDMAKAGQVVRRLTEMVEDPSHEWFGPEVRSCAGFQALYEGELGAARTHLEAALDGLQARPEGATVSQFWPLPNHPVAVSAIALACVATLEGNAGDASRWEAVALDTAERLPFPQGPFSVAFVTTYAAWLRRVVGEAEASRELGAGVVAVGQRHGFAYWVALGALYVAADPAAVEAALDMLRAIGHQAFEASSLQYLAEMYAAAGQPDRAAEAIEGALATAARSGEALHTPDLLRTRAELALAADPHSAAAAHDLAEARRLAQRQGSHLVALRAAVAAARLPETIRPREWRNHLEEALAALPAEAPHAEAGDARRILTS